jgi:folylpolyglutamate synthase/dihydropteroate synthase
MPADLLANVIQHVATNVQTRKNPEDALELAMSKAEDRDVILGTGSLYVAGAIRDAYMAST